MLNHNIPKKLADAPQQSIFKSIVLHLLPRISRLGAVGQYHSVLTLPFLYSLAKCGLHPSIYAPLLCDLVEEEYLLGHNRTLCREPGRWGNDVDIGSKYINQKQ